MSTINKLLVIWVVLVATSMTQNLPAYDWQTSKEKSANTVVDIAERNNQQFSTFIQALEDADLITTLRTGGPYTIFAPNNAAFEKYKDFDQAQLKKILLYHVVPTQIQSRDLRDMELVTDTDGDLLIQTRGNKAFVNGAEIIQADISASNGTIHMIDRVLNPPSIRR